MGLKYKVGDKILVEAEIVEIDDSDTPYSLKVLADAKDYWVTEKVLENSVVKLEKPEFKVGELIEASVDGQEWHPKKFLFKHRGLNYCLHSSRNNEFILGYDISDYIITRKYIRKIQKTETQENKLKNFSEKELLAELIKRNEEKK